MQPAGLVAPEMSSTFNASLIIYVWHIPCQFYVDYVYLSYMVI